MESVNSIEIAKTQEEENEKPSSLDTTSHDDKKKHKRTKGATDQEKKYSCNACNKKYLSYPALYLHCKTKHGTRMPIQKDSIVKGRGRPKKKVPSDIIKSKEFFNSVDKTGVTTDIVANLQEMSLSLYNKKQHPLEQSLSYALNHIQVAQDNASCDTVFAEYLVYAASLCNKEFYSRVVMFILLFRDCFQNSSAGSPKNIIHADTMPEFSNEFISIYIKDKKFPNSLAVELTQNFCEWMFRVGYTSLKISLI
jgi:hypothetical protein